MECVVFDTSFLLNSVKSKVDFLKDLELRLGSFKPIVTSPVLLELQKLSHKMPEARVALQLVGLAEFEVVESALKADDSVVKVAASMGGYLASTDKEVRKKGEEMGLRLVTLRKGRHIQV